MLEGLNLTKSFNGTRVLNDISISLEPGEILVIIGPSGCGKTTLLKLLGLLDQPDSGEVLIDKERFSLKAQKNSPWPKVTAVFQQLFLWPHLTLLDNITLPLTVQKKDIDRARLKELTELFDMSGFLHRYPNEVSGGQRQRAALVRAVMLNPTYMLLDEITSSLDVEQIARLVPYIKELAKRGIGILTITHLLHFARQTADRVIFMDGGTILESGTRQVLTNPKQERVQRFMSVLEYAS